MSKTWPYDSLTTPPTNLKEAIDWVLRVTGKDGKKNTAASSKDSAPHCLCYLAKAIKDLLYDARSPGTPGPSPKRYWDDLLLEQEESIVMPVLTDLGLLSGSTGAASSTCAGGTEVIGTLIDQLALGLQKWVGWQEGDSDKCCLKGDKGIGKKCKCPAGVGGQCCSPGGPSTTTCHQCNQCGTGATAGDKKCYLSAYCKTKSTSGGGSSGAGQSDGDYYWPTISSDSDKVHLLARIFLGSVCLIWSGLSQLGFLTGKDRWKEKTLTSESDGLGSFMAAMGYDLDRLNQGGQKGEFVHTLLTNTVGWKDLSNGTNSNSVAEYYSEIYKNAKGKNTEEICTKYPLLVLHILASGYFRAGSAGANKITPAPKAPSSDPRKPRNPRTIREILYWLSALPYSEKYCQLVERMQQKTDQVNKGGNISLEGTGAEKTQLSKDCVTHYLLAACGYCPLVLIGIQGTIATSGSDPTTSGGGGGGGSGSSSSTTTDDKRCPKHKEDPSSKRCNFDEIKKRKEEAAKAQATQVQQQQQQQQPDNGELQEGEVCYGGYHLAVSQFGPLHGMYANGLFGFDMDGSPAQCLDQLRVYVYHCFYQLYFLRKQCTVGVEGTTVLGWKSCRYGSGVNPSGGVSNQNPWRCEAQGSGQDCQCKKTAGHQSPLMYFLCDGLGPLVCKKTVGVGLGSNKQSYPEIDAHMNKTVDSKGKEHEPHRQYPQLCPVPMGWSAETGTGNTQQRENHFKDLKDTHKTEQLSGAKAGQDKKYPAHCTGRTLSHLLEYYCDPEKCPSGTLVVLLRLLACITPTVPRTLGDLFGFYYYIVYIGGNSASGGKEVHEKLKGKEEESKLYMPSIGGGGKDAVVSALTTWSTGGNCSNKNDTLKCLTDCSNGTGAKYLSPLSGQQYGQLSPLMAGTYLSWLVYLIGEFKQGLEGLKEDYMNIQCKDDCQGAGAVGCGGTGQCRQGTHGTMCSTGGSQGVCQCTSVVSCTGVLPVLYKYGFGYGNVTELHKTTGGGADSNKKCHDFLGTLEKVLTGDHLKKGSKGNLHHEINKLIYTTRLPWIFVLTVAWLVAVLYLAFGAIWPLDWTHMRSHCRGWFRKGSLSPWEVLMVGKKKGRSIVEYFGRT